MGAKVSDASAALSCACVPLNVIVASAVPSPVVNVRPVSVPIVSVPLVTVSVTVSGPPSTSLTVSALPPTKATVVSSLIVTAAGAELVGASLTGVMVPLTVAVDVAPDGSAMVYVNDVAPLKSAVGVNTRLPDMLSATVPPVTATLAPPAVMAVPLTCVTVSVSFSGSLSFARTLIVAGPLSSAIVKLSLTASGASFTGITVIDVTAVLEFALPSLTVTLTVRVTADGFSLVDE